MLLLREIWWEGVGLAAGSPARDSNGKPADLLRRVEVPLQQRRRKVADRDIVEAVARIVAGQQRTDVDIDRQQVAHRIVIFGAI